MSKPNPTRHAPEEVDAYPASLPEALLVRALRALRARLAKLEDVTKED